MPHNSRQFINGEIYHIVLKRVGNEELFIDINDYYREIFSIYEFNNDQPVNIWKRRKRRLTEKRIQKEIEQLNQGDTQGRGLPSPGLSSVDPRDRFVDVLTFCLMPNHIHLLVKQLKERGISKYMQKMGSGYSVYFRIKYGLKMKGHFFQDRFTAVRIKTDEQLMVVFVYIHVNPLSLIEPGWKEKGIKYPEKAIKFLENKYRWSSYFDYIGKNNFPSVTERNFLLEVMGGREGCKKAINNWIRYKGEIKKFPEILLE